MAGGWEDAHVQADLGDDHLGGLAADAGDLIQAVDGGQHLGAVAPPGGRAGGAAGVDALGGGDRGDQLLDPGGELADLGGQGVDLVQQQARKATPEPANPPAPSRADREVISGMLPAVAGVPAGAGA